MSAGATSEVRMQAEDLQHAGFDFAGLHAQQAIHSVVPVVPLGRLVALGPAAAVELVNDRRAMIARMTPKGLESDLLRWAYDPPAWRRIDLEMARKRLEHPGTCLELYVLGGHDSGKTNGGVMRMTRHFFYTRQAWVWGLHSTEKSSKTIHQDRVFDFWPPELRARMGKTGGMRRTMQQKAKFGEGTGFTDNQFNVKWHVKGLHGAKDPVMCGGLFEFKFFASENKNLQGAKITCANADELADKATKDTMVQRAIPRARETAEPVFLELIRRCVRILEVLDGDGHPRQQLPAELQALLYTGVVILGFTPIEGYSPLVAGVLDGALTTWMEDGKLLPIKDEGGGMKDEKFKQVPRLKQPKSPTQLVAYLHTHHNPFTNLPGKIADCQGKSERYIRMTYYGDVAKDWAVDFSPPFNETHHVLWDRSLVPRVGTWRLVLDPARARPWFMGFYMTDEQVRRYALREWPQEGAVIPGHGDPGAWAVISEHGRMNGDAGPAQGLRLGWGFAEYVREIFRVLMEIGAWWFTRVQQRERWVKISWPGFPDWTLEGVPVPLEEIRMDPRFAASGSAVAHGEQDYLEGLRAAFEAVVIEGPGERFIPRGGYEVLVAPGKHLDIGNGLIINALGGYNPATFDAKQPGAMNCPNFRVWHECAGHIFTLLNFSLESTRSDTSRKDEACKDPRDVMAMHELSGPEHLGNVVRHSSVRGGASAGGTTRNGIGDWA